MNNLTYILHIDDDVDDLFVFREAIHFIDKGIRLQQETDAITALTHLHSAHTEMMLPGLIVVDLNMPRMSGKEFLAEIYRKSWFPVVPVVALTTSSLAADRDYCKNIGVPCLTKPSLFDDLVELTQQLLLLCQRRSIS